MLLSQSPLKPGADMRWKQKTAVGWGVGVGSGGREWGGEWDSGKNFAFLIKKTDVASLLLPFSSLLSVLGGDVLLESEKC